MTAEIDFGLYRYYPALQSAPPEHLGYQRLPDTDKDLLLPIFELNWRRGKADLNPAVELIKESAAKRSFILDLSKEPAPPAFIPQSGPTKESIEQQAISDAYNLLLAKLLNPDDGFREWRTFAAQFPNAIPTLQFEDAAAQSRQILRQAALFLKSRSALAIRVTLDVDDTIFTVIGQIFSILDNPGQLLVVLDAGQGRVGFKNRAEESARRLTLLHKEVPVTQRHLLRIVQMSSSFPSALKDDLSTVKSYDWSLWRKVREAGVVLFGDYGGIRRHQNNWFIPSEWRATTIYPFDEAWLVYRDENAQDSGGWIKGAGKISKADGYSSEAGIWGSDAIERAKRGKLDGMEQVQNWRAAAVNLHLHRQIRVAGDAVTHFGSGEDDE